ncbi:hypothetical protein MidiMira_02 [Proteus phage MidiMira-UFV02]|nr:hypothetical protein BigMira_02 [Proteus phage BigMira-UFV01]WJJ57729.1 hypothetical protein MidiMira_02 [Proteus phage MidiMira-UFV02]
MKLDKMRKAALYMMSYGASFYTYRYIMMYEKVSYNNIKVRRNIKKRYIKKAWQQAKAELDRAKARTLSYSKCYSGAQANFIIFDEV